MTWPSDTYGVLMHLIINICLSLTTVLYFVTETKYALETKHISHNTKGSIHVLPNKVGKLQIGH